MVPVTTRAVSIRRENMHKLLLKVHNTIPAFVKGRHGNTRDIAGPDMAKLTLLL